MFLVFNKEKIYAYLVSILTVCLLFFIASTNNQKDIETDSKIETSYNTNKSINNESADSEDKNSNDDNEKEECSSLVPNDDTNSIDTSGFISSNDN